MGSADIIPGVSGGTIAFITGIYEKLLQSIKSIDQKAFQLLIQAKLREFWTKIDGRFLVTLLSGIVVSIFTLARVISYFLEHHPIPLWSFFFGLILISALIVSRDITKWNFAVVTALILGIIAAYLITEAIPGATPNTYPLIFISGAVAICAMILPGISGSFILLLLGKYTFIISSLKELSWPVILVFVAGCIVGLLSFSRVIHWMLQKYRDLTIAVLVGFMLGSLNKIWPWKQVVSEEPLVEDNILPTTFQELGQEPYIMQAMLFFALGVAIVALLERAANYLKS